VGQLDEAVNTYENAREAIATAQAEAARIVAQARADAEQRRLQLAEAIVAAYLAGMRQVEIIRRTGYSREQVRTILRRAGVEAE
jgi:DNA-binding CsgD family transcriptional regulator